MVFCFNLLTKSVHYIATFSLETFFFVEKHKFIIDMKFVISLVVLLIGLIELHFSKGEHDKLPDNGRMEVGTCLYGCFKWEEDGIREVEDFLFDLCLRTYHDNFHIQKELERAKISSQDAYKKMNQCLGDKAKDLIERYKGLAVDSLRNADELNEYTDMNQVVLGLCGEQELVTYEKLDNEEQKIAATCLENCTVKLFKKFELLIERLNREYKKFLETQPEIAVEDKGEEKENTIKASDISKITQEKENVSVSEKPTNDEENNNKTKNDKKKIGDLIKELLETDVSDGNPYTFDRTIKQYQEVCERIDEYSIKALTSVGKIWAKEYMEVIEALFKRHPAKEVKLDARAALDSYLYCTRWVCAMRPIEDIPLLDWVSDTKTDIHVD